MPMKILKAEDRVSRRAPAQWFTGEVWMEEYVRGTGASRVQAVLVTYAPEARTAWHTHPISQTLQIVSGVGLIQLRGEAVRTLYPGDTVLIAANEMHWHGAAPGHMMAHLAVQEADATGENVYWFEHVTDAEYSACG
jgi:quercetin dioxygenase-like cupin family protein